MAVDDVDWRVRTEAFAFLDRLSLTHGDVVPRTALAAGFSWQGHRVPLIGAQGIFKPAVLDVAPLSITTVPAVAGRARPYDDEVTDDGLLRYRYRGTDPPHRDNVGLRTAMARQLPLVYLHGISPGRYRPEWPVFVVGDDPGTLTFTVAVDDPAALDVSPGTVDPARRAYATRLARVRLHQLEFRERVITAYRTSCALCRLRRPELLDAAHIIPDAHPSGEPTVTNGMAMCKLHHAAFDRNIVGVRPDLVVEVRHDVLDEIDGPMLRHGLQDLHGQDLVVIPKRAADQPDPLRLAERYEQFRLAG